MIKWFKYVPLADMAAWVALGWRDTGAMVDTHHGLYSELMEWCGEGEPVIPSK